MPNMSYCRFENTVNDMNDCLNAIEDREVNDLSDYEVLWLERCRVMQEDLEQKRTGWTVTPVENERK